FQRCVALSGCVAEIWLGDDPDRARTHALQRVHNALGMDSPRFEAVLRQIDQMLPELSALFDLPLPSPARLNYLLEHAAELITLRNLRELQDASLARQRAADFAAMARQLSEQSHLDALTGVLSRRQLHVVLEQEFNRSSQLEKPLSVAFIDLDDFKKINDLHGHLTGDRVLQAFAEKLKGQLRSSDTVARFGGEEFVVIFPATTEQLALQIVRRVLQAIADTP